MLGVVIGVAAVIMIATLGSGASAMISDRVATMGDRLLFANPSAGGDGPFSEKASHPFSMQDVESIKNHVDGLAGVAPTTSASATAVYGNKNRKVNVNGVTPDYFSVRDASVLRGSLFEPTHYLGGTLQCILGKTVREDLFGSADPVGAVIRVGSASCQVIGELRSKGQTGFGNDQDDVILAPLRAVQGRLVGNQDIYSIAVAVEPWADIKHVAKAMEALLRERRHIQEGDADDFEVMDLTQVANVISDITGVLTLFLSTIAGVSLVVGGIGIMNIMLVSVTERTREIGIRLAIGALEREVLLQFLIEAVLLTTVGGAIGVLTGLSLSFGISRLANFPFTVDLAMIGMAFAFCVVIGVAFGYLPARRAARLDPIEALHRE
jgi:putative ABC transport system permease protein